jgi:chromosome segregation ATPase
MNQNTLHKKIGKYHNKYDGAVSTEKKTEYKKKINYYVDILTQSGGVLEGQNKEMYERLMAEDTVKPQIEVLTNAISDLSDKIRQKMAEILDLNKRLDDAARITGENDTMIAKLKATKDQEAAEITRLGAEIARLKTELNNVTAAKVEKEQAHAQATRELEEAREASKNISNAEIAKLKAYIFRLETEKIKDDKNIGELRTRVATLEKSLDDAIELAKTNKSKTEKKIEDLEKANDVLKKAVDDTSSQNTELQNALQKIDVKHTADIKANNAALKLAMEKSTELTNIVNGTNQPQQGGGDLVLDTTEAMTLGWSDVSPDTYY